MTTFNDGSHYTLHPMYGKAEGCPRCKRVTWRFIRTRVCPKCSDPEAYFDTATDLDSGVVRKERMTAGSFATAKRKATMRTLAIDEYLKGPYGHDPRVGRWEEEEAKRER